MYRQRNHGGPNSFLILDDNMFVTNGWLPKLGTVLNYKVDIYQKVVQTGEFIPLPNSITCQSVQYIQSILL